MEDEEQHLRDLVEERSYLLSAAAWQDSLLQTYRTLGLTVNSILLAVGSAITLATVAADDDVITFTFALLVFVLSGLGFKMTSGFKGIVHARGRDVDFWHRRLIELENGLPADQRHFTAFKYDQKLRRDDSDHVSRHLQLGQLDRSDIDELLGKHMGHTRRFIDVRIVWGMRVLWGVFLVLAGGAAVTAIFVA